MQDKNLHQPDCAERFKVAFAIRFLQHGSTADSHAIGAAGHRVARLTFPASGLGVAARANSGASFTTSANDVSPPNQPEQQENCSSTVMETVAAYERRSESTNLEKRSCREQQKCVSPGGHIRLSQTHRASPCTRSPDRPSSLRPGCTRDS